MGVTLSEYFDDTIKCLSKRDGLPPILQKLLGPDPQLIDGFSKTILTSGTQFADAATYQGTEMSQEEGVLKMIDTQQSLINRTPAPEVFFKSGDVQKIANRYGMETANYHQSRGFVFGE